MERNDIEKDIQRIFKENKMWYDWDVDFDGSVEINVEWGDWKHDHLHLNHVMKENGYILMGEKVTEEDGSDSYSAVHTYFKYDTVDEVFNDITSKIVWKGTPRGNGSPYEFFSDYINDYYRMTLLDNDKVCKKLKDFYGIKEFYAYEMTEK